MKKNNQRIQGIRIAGILRHQLRLLLAVLLVFSISIGTTTINAFVLTTTSQIKGRIRNYGKNENEYCRSSSSSSSSQLHSVVQAVEAATAAHQGLSDYAPAAALLFNNMKLPAAVVTAGMISLGFATRFPELPPDSLERVYDPPLRQRCAKLERLHVVVALISVTSELIVVLWAAVSVNQLTERPYAPASSVWDLIQRDCDLAWSAVNSHFILGIIGFIGMLWLRAYVMLLAVKASKQLMVAASTGTAAALCLMVSVVNRGVESGGGNSQDRYGNTILDLFQHYATLLLKVGMDAESPGPLQLSAIGLETTSLCFLLLVLLKESDASFEEQPDDDSCLLVDLENYDLNNGDERGETLSVQELEKLNTCMALQEEERQRQQEDPTIAEKRRKEELRKSDQAGDSSVNII